MKEKDFPNHQDHSSHATPRENDAQRELQSARENAEVKELSNERESLAFASKAEKGETVGLSSESVPERRQLSSSLQAHSDAGSYGKDRLGLRKVFDRWFPHKRDERRTLFIGYVSSALGYVATTSGGMIIGLEVVPPIGIAASGLLATTILAHVTFMRLESRRSSK